LIKRKVVKESDRIKVTSSMINSCNYRSVLEIGAGDYSFKDTHKKQNEGIWIRLDISPPCEIQMDINCQVLRLPFKDNEFDLIIITQVLEHLLWPQAILSECHRCLSKDGFIIASVPNVVSLTYRIAWLLGRLPCNAASGNIIRKCGTTSYIDTSGGIVGGHVADYNIKRLKMLFTILGFVVEEIRGSGIYWRNRQVFPACLLPANLSSNLIIKALKNTTI
jgi:SAM-dependent methyltransferase